MVYYKFTMRSRGTQEYQKKIMVLLFSLENKYSNGIKAYFNLAGINCLEFWSTFCRKKQSFVRRHFPRKNCLE